MIIQMILSLKNFFSILICAKGVQFEYCDLTYSHFCLSNLGYLILTPFAWKRCIWNMQSNFIFTIVHIKPIMISKASEKLWIHEVTEQIMVQKIFVLVAATPYVPPVSIVSYHVVKENRKRPRFEMLCMLWNQENWDFFRLDCTQYLRCSALKLWVS